MNNKMLKILLLTVFLYSAFFISNLYASMVLSKPYDSYSVCIADRDSNNLKYPDWERGDCYTSANNKYFYNLCQGGEGCGSTQMKQADTVLSTIASISGENPYMGSVESDIQNKINLIITGLAAKKNTSNVADLIISIDKIRVKLATLRTNYSQNKKVLDIIGFLDYELQKLKAEFSNETISTNDGVDNFFCDLLGNCSEENKPLSTSITPINTSNTGVNQVATSNSYGSCNFSGSNTFYYKTNNSCISAMFACNNAQLQRGTQFSPAPLQPAVGIKLYATSTECSGVGQGNLTITTTESTINTAQSNSVTTTISGIAKENTLVCAEVLSNPSAPTGVNAGYCSDESKYVLRTESNEWKYTNNSWVGTYNKNSTSWTSVNGLKLKLFTLDKISKQKVAWTINITSQASSQGPVQNQTDSCNGTVPTGEGIVSCGANCGNTGFNKNNWEFAQNPTYSCSWGCSNGYVRPSLTANYCVKSDKPIFNGNDVKVEVGGSYQNCSSVGAGLSLTVWNAGPDIKLCQEFEITTPSRKGEKNNCDLDSKFVPASQAWSNGYNGGKWSYYTSLTNHATIVPGKYRLAVKSTDGTVTYSQWYTVGTSGSFSNPENCNYYAYPAKNVEDAIWYILNTKNVHFSYGIDWTEIKKTCPKAQVEFIRYAHMSEGYFEYSQSPNIGGGGRTGGAFLSECYSRPIPTWNGPTHIGGFGKVVPGQENNDVVFDFQSWYNGGNAWTLGGTACGNVPNHGKSQLYGGIKWEYGKVFDCTNKTYGGVSVSGTSASNQNISCTLSDGTKLSTGSTKELFYKNDSTCFGANYSCTNGQLIWGSQFSPAPPQPIAGATLFVNRSLCEGEVSVTHTKNTLKEVGDSIYYTITGLGTDGQACQSVHAHPNAPSAVSPNRCEDVKNFVYLRDLNKWTYTNGIWNATMESNTNIYVAGVKVQSHFRNPNTGKVKSGNIIEVIK